jgi:predicted ArsR family transcriptional regulator
MADGNEGSPGGGQRSLPGFDPDRDLLLEPRMLRGLAHPLRIRLRAELLENGPATASQLAARVGESSGATSYHLRQLAAYGFITDDPGRGSGRERYWRAAHRMVTFDMPEPGSPEHAVGAEYLRAVARLYAERIIRFADGIEAAPEVLGKQWAEAADLSNWLLDLDVAEAAALKQRFHELCAAYRHDDTHPRPGTRRVVVQFQLFPAPPHASAGSSGDPS